MMFSCLHLVCQLGYLQYFSSLCSALLRGKKQQLWDAPESGLPGSGSNSRLAFADHVFCDCLMIALLSCRRLKWSSPWWPTLYLPEQKANIEGDLFEGITLHGPAHTQLYQHTTTPASPWDRRGLCPHSCTPAPLQALGTSSCCNIFLFQQFVA